MTALNRCTLVLLTALVLVSIQHVAMAQALQPIHNPKTWAEDFFRRLQKNPASAYALLKTATRHPEKMEAAEGGTTQAIKVFGPMLGAELVEDAAAGKSVKRLTYIARHQHGPVMYQIFLYAPVEGSWEVSGMEITGDAGQFPFEPAK